MSKIPYQICANCVMDTTADEISFDEKGVCSFCKNFLIKANHVINPDDKLRERELDKLVETIKKKGKGKKYDCIVGVSGGVDSSWVLVNTVQKGLRPLAVHMDNGWNSELAQNNIANLVKSLGVDLYTHVINWNEYRGLMQAFFDADVIDIELLYDNAMLSVNFTQAKKNGICFIVSGSNHITEGMAMPINWSWFKLDKRHIKALARINNVKLKTFPIIGTLEHIWYRLIKGIQWLWYIDYLHYNKAEVMQELQKNYGYKPYPYKHYESIFTRFYQGYILPEKFGVDKRRVHFSTLIMSGQMTRQSALENLKGIPYFSNQELTSDKNYFLKKMGWTREQLEDYIKRPGKQHSNYKSEAGLFSLCLSLRNRFFKKSN
jgi:N-acetyl sugar amidotransferase